MRHGKMERAIIDWGGGNLFFDGDGALQFKPSGAINLQFAISECWHADLIVCLSPHGALAMGGHRGYGGKLRGVIPAVVRVV